MCIGEWVKAETWLRSGIHFPERMKQGRTSRSLWVHKKEEAIEVEGLSITPSSSLPHPPLGEPVLVCNCLNDGKAIASMQLPECGHPHAGNLCRSKELQGPTIPYRWLRQAGCPGFAQLLPPQAAPPWSQRQGLRGREGCNEPRVAAETA